MRLHPSSKRSLYPMSIYPLPNPRNPHPHPSLIPVKISESTVRLDGVMKTYSVVVQLSVILSSLPITFLPFYHPMTSPEPTLTLSWLNQNNHLNSTQSRTYKLLGMGKISHKPHSPIGQRPTLGLSDLWIAIGCRCGVD